MKKLSTCQIEALLMIAEACERGEEDGSFFVAPLSSTSKLVNVGKYDSNGKLETKLRSISVHGSTFRSLARNGLVKRPQQTSLPELTEEGQIAVEVYRESR
jgi:hypothetical protein